MFLELMYITNDPTVALIAEKCGVNRIFVDLETLGKEERQKGMDSVKSHHSINDVENLANTLTEAELMVRINPWNPNSKEEIEQVISAGANRIMLPMWKSPHEVENFLDAVGRRVSTTLLLETKEAAECIDSVLALPLLDEIHIGLNDLHLSYSLTFMFELLTNGTVETLCNKMKSAGIRYGFGGIARIGTGMLPAEKIITEHFRLGSTRAILSRSFCDALKISDIQEIDNIFTVNMKSLREFEKTLPQLTEKQFSENSESIKICVDEIIKVIKGKNE